jgi:hypothetical protein
MPSTRVVMAPVRVGKVDSNKAVTFITTGSEKRRFAVGN